MKRKIISCLMLVLLCMVFTSCGSAEKQNPADCSAFELQSFKELYESGKLSWENETVKADSSLATGILIQGDNKKLSETRFLIDESYDFASSYLQRIMISGLGKKDTVTKVCIYLDNEQNPVTEITLPSAEKDGSWDQDIRNANTIVLDQKITGTHKVEFSVCQYLKNGEKSSDESASVLLSQLQFVAESIPLIHIRIDESQGTIEDMNADPEHMKECYGEMDILTSDGYTGEDGEVYKGGTFRLSSIRGRGNSTWKTGLRRPYRIKLENAENLFGMGADKNWALLANAYDNTLMRNAFTYKLGEMLDLSFTPQGVPVDVVMNGEYLGSYYLCENVRVNPERIAIDDLDLEKETENITGGYLLGTSSIGADEDAYVFETLHGETFTVNSPCDAENPEYMNEIDYITEYIQRVENALYREPDPVTGEVEDPFSLMDLDSAVRYYWIQELSNNRDFFVTSSTYCYKVKDGKLFWGPLWDFDVAWDSSNLDISEWSAKISWFQIMMTHDEFVEAAETCYKDTVKPLLDDMLSENGYLNTYYDTIRYSASNNFAIWGISNDPLEIQREWGVEPDRSNLKFDKESIPTIFRSEYEEFREVIKVRAQWCSEHLDDLKAENVKVVFMAEDEVVDTKTGFIGIQMDSLAETPVVEGKQFVGWYYKGKDEEGNPVNSVFNNYVPIEKSAVEEVDGEKCLFVYADLVDRDESLNITSVDFQQSSYHLYISKDNNGMLYIPVKTEPYDGYDDEIVWEVDDPSILSLERFDKKYCLFPVKEGKTVLSAILTDGNVCSVTVEVREISGKPDAYAVTDFRFTEESLTLAKGEHELVGIEVLSPENYMNIPNSSLVEYEWYIESGDACSVDEEGIITAEHAGKAVVACKNSVSGVTHSISVEVTGE